MKLYGEVAGSIKFPPEVDETLQQTIYDWYQYREVCDDEKFELFFLRVLNAHINRYNQILRIEPGIANYDWLVERYLERENRVIGASETSTKSSGESKNAGDVTVKNSGADTIRATHGHTVTDGGIDERLDSYGKTVQHDNQDETRVKYGRVDTTATTETGSVKHGLTDTVMKTGSDAITHGAQAETEEKTSDKKTGETSRETTDTRVVHTDTGSDDYHVTDQKTLAKNNPMSVSYQGGISSPSVDQDEPLGGDGASGGSLDWTSPSAQGAQYGRNYDHTDNKQTVYVDDGGKLVEVESFKGREDTRERTVTEKSSGTDTTQYNTTETSAKSGTDSTESKKDSSVTASGEDYTNIKSDGTETHGGADKETTTYGKTETHSGTDVTATERGTTTVTTDGRTTKSETDVTKKGETDTTSRTVHTGRQHAPADLMQQAKSFIVTTSAWEFMRERIEPCFMSIYEY